MGWAFQRVQRIVGEGRSREMEESGVVGKGSTGQNGDGVGEDR